MSHHDVVISGFGGQGVILTGIVLGKAISIYSDGFATMTQNFGPEARGGACTAQVVLGDEPIRYPYVQKADVLIVMSQEAYDKHTPTMGADGLLLYEEELIDLGEPRKDVRMYGIPAARFAEELGNSMVLNMIMIGFLAGTSGIVSADAAKKAIKASVPSHLAELNSRAFEKGYQYGKGKVARTEIVSEANK